MRPASQRHSSRSRRTSWPGRRPGEQCRHHARQAVPPHGRAKDWTDVIEHQSQRPLQHDAPDLARHAGSKVRPRHQHLVDQRPEGPVRPGELFCRQGRRPRVHQGALAQEGARNNITVNAICPGYIATEMVMAVPEDARNKIIAQIPVGRLASQRKSRAAWCSWPPTKAGFITGSTISANGGQFFS